MGKRWGGLAAALVVLGGATSAFADPPPAPESEHLAAAMLSDTFAIETTGPSDLHFERVTLASGGSSGWHAHAGPTFVAVKAGTLTIHRAGADGCTDQAYPAGEGFFEPADEAHIAINHGSEAVEVYVAHIVDAGTEVTKSLESPGGNCPG